MSWGCYQHKCLAQPCVDGAQLLTQQLNNELLNAWRVPTRLQSYISYLSAANEMQVSEPPSVSVSPMWYTSRRIGTQSSEKSLAYRKHGYSVISGADSRPEGDTQSQRDTSLRGLEINHALFDFRSGGSGGCLAFLPILE